MNVSSRRSRQGTVRELRRGGVADTKAISSSSLLFLVAVVARQPDGAVAQVLPPSVPYTAVARDEKFSLVLISEKNRAT